MNGNLRYHRRLIALSCLLVSLSAGCRQRTPSATAAREVRDGLGRTVRLPPADRVQRIVSLAPSSTEILFALSAGGAVVGVDRYGDFPPAAKALPQLGNDVDPNLERLLALKPDVVFTAPRPTPSAPSRRWRG